jgi:Long-chain fatty acid transport protein
MKTEHSILVPCKIFTSVAAAFTIGLASSNVSAAAFALQEQSGSGLGTAFAGPAEAADASSMYTNPATLSKRKAIQIVGAAHIATPSMKFKDSGSLTAFNQHQLGGNGGDAGSVNFLGNLYIAVPISERWTFGLGNGAPFGLVSKYDRDWAGRYLGVESDVKSFNVNPAISFKINDRLSVGLGLNWQYLHAKFTNAVNYSAALGNAAQAAAAQGMIPAELVPAVIGATGGLDSFSTVKGQNNDAWGINGGFLFELDENTRFSFAYRSEIKQKMEGTVRFSHPDLNGVPADLQQIVGGLGQIVNQQLYDGKVRAEITLPAVANISAYHQVTPRLGLMADLQWTEWSSLQYLTFERIDGSILQETPEKFRNTWRIAVGANYRINDRWLGRFGMAYDQSPVREEHRTPRLPDAHRVWFALGGQYAIDQRMNLDFGFAYLHAKDKKIFDNAGNPALYGQLDGYYKNYATVASMQLTYTF